VASSSLILASIASFTNDAYTAAGQTPYSKFANPASLGKVQTGRPPRFCETAPIRNYQLTLSGGSDKVNICFQRVIEAGWNHY